MQDILHTSNVEFFFKPHYFLPGWLKDFFCDEQNQFSRGIDTSQGVAKNQRAICIAVVGHKTDESFVFHSFSWHSDAYWQTGRRREFVKRRKALRIQQLHFLQPTPLHMFQRSCPLARIFVPLHCVFLPSVLLTSCGEGIDTIS